MPCIQNDIMHGEHSVPAAATVSAIFASAIVATTAM
eukprot:CAMPEP_0178726606 /NCGR_PEP_ID=MMETSP0699-20121125/27391_1 /TAXON_ID=265572 /ORGANISM="Extubocellulus spinifer, Strain CCMP396" /LENGTH=35 /DNA_ID= /DNA_START= /DNA_END= /DNA_ORIENTATION=